MYPDIRPWADIVRISPCSLTRSRIVLAIESRMRARLPPISNCTRIAVTTRSRSSLLTQPTRDPRRRHLEDEEFPNRQPHIGPGPLRLERRGECPPRYRGLEPVGQQLGDLDGCRLLLLLVAQLEWSRAITPQAYLQPAHI